MRCEQCGNDVSEGLGDWVDRGFVCRICQDALGYLLCNKCGRKFRKDDMIEFDEKFYCKNCVKVKKPTVVQKPVSKFGGGAMIPRKQLRTRKTAKDLDPGLFSNVRKPAKSKEDAATPGEFKELENEIRGESEEIDRKDEDIDSIEELRQLQEKLKESRIKKKKKENEDFSLKDE